MEEKFRMFNDDYLYIVKVHDDGETYSYEYGNQRHAMEHYKEELAKGNNTELFRHNVVTGKTQRYQEKPCNCAKCAPKKIQYMPRKAN